MLIDEFYRIFAAVSVATLITVAFVALCPARYAGISSAHDAALGLGRGAGHHHLGPLSCTAACQRLLQRRGIGAERVLIVGTGEVGRMILQKIQHTPGLGYQVVGFVEASFDGRRLRQVMGLPVFGAVDDLPEDHRRPQASTR